MPNPCTSRSWSRWDSLTTCQVTPTVVSFALNQAATRSISGASRVVSPRVAPYAASSTGGLSMISGSACVPAWTKGRRRSSARSTTRERMESPAQSQFRKSVSNAVHEDFRLDRQRDPSVVRVMAQVSGRRGVPGVVDGGHGLASLARPMDLRDGEEGRRRAAGRIVVRDRLLVVVVRDGRNEGHFEAHAVAAHERDADGLADVAADVGGDEGGAVHGDGAGA